MRCTTLKQLSAKRIRLLGPPRHRGKRGGAIGRFRPSAPVRAADRADHSDESVKHVGGLHFERTVAAEGAVTVCLLPRILHPTIGGAPAVRPNLRTRGARPKTIA